MPTKAPKIIRPVSKPRGVTSPAPKAAVIVRPVIGATVSKAKAAAKRSTAPVNAPLGSASTAQLAARDTKLAAKPANTPRAKAATTATPASDATRFERLAARDSKYLLAGTYPAEHHSADDIAYLHLFSAFCKAANNGIANVSAITATKAKPPGISIVNNRARLRRLVIHGLCEHTTADKLSFRVTANGQKLAAYTTAKPYSA